MLIPNIKIHDIDDATKIAEHMEGLDSHPLACVNWAEEYPYKPDVSFKIAHNDSHLFLEYFVEEQEVLALTNQDNGSVWTDSCVEFFIAFGDSSQYYNLESSCIGKILMGYRQRKVDAVHADFQVLQSIKRYPSLGNSNFDKKTGDCKWSILLVIPVTAFWMSDINEFSGIEARANFYKCGDHLSAPHFLSWAPVKSERPNFHLVDFFDTIRFE